MSIPIGDEFHPDLLSERERAVLALATEGRTDEHIARALDISTSTVNSYWVRIRGKLGQLSRTELVAAVLRREMDVRNASLREENARLIAEARAQEERTQELLARLAALGNPAWGPLALASLPDAALVVGPPATVVYANRRALKVYRARTAQDLEGMSMRELTIARTPERLREPCREMLRPGGPGLETHGIDGPYYALRRDGTNFRAVVKAEHFETPEGAFAALTVREFMEEAEAGVRALREPLGGS